ncbi:hypothetical protein GGR50DRAFT_680773 [Xylaria sp. CBS 124048]|nr:hypothetical protein GGR50DRAFT_680773 [Xylaria sp. CBS 124048]
MLFAEEDAPLIKAWIVRRLENNSDADADVLADYVLALLRHDGDVETIRRLFEDEIPDFLREDAAAFTHDVLQAVKYRSFVPGAAPPPPASVLPSLGVRQPHYPLPQASTHAVPQSDLPTKSPISLYNPAAPYATTSVPPLSQRNSRKRAHSEHDDGDVDIILTNQTPYGGQPYKQQRRGGGFGQRGGRYDDVYGSRSYRGAPQFPAVPPAPAPYGAPLPFGPPALDASSILENIQILQSLLPTADLPPPLYSGVGNTAPRRRKQRCRDYESKGYCSRGNKCNFEHDAQPLYIPPPIPAAVDEYDPNNAALSLPPLGLLQPPTGPKLGLSGPLPLPLPSTNRGEIKKARRIKGRPPIAATGPNHDKTKSSIVVQNIPTENCTEDQVRGYFSQFGSITEVVMKAQNNTAMIKFESWESANAAWSSPKVIFDNRFVKVFWQKEDGAKEEAGQEPVPNAKLTNDKSDGHTNGTALASETTQTEPELDLKEFHRRQLEAQKIHEAKRKQRETIGLERQQLMECQKELQQRQAEAKRQLQAKLKVSSAKNGVPPLTADPSTQSKDKKTSAQTEVLKAQLAALEREANQLGIDPDEAHDDTSPWFARGRGRGRVYRGRGTFVPRAIRAGYGYQGRGGAVEARHAAYAVYSLDNRPKSVALSGVDLTTTENDEALRQYLFSVGEFNEIHSAPAVTHVTFKDRKTAEKFMFGITTGHSIHGIEGKVKAAWASSAPQSAKTTVEVDTGNPEEDHNMKEKSDAGPNGADENLEEGEIDNGPVLELDQGDMDYEAGEW